jgi:Zn-dependent peptidase ImmA (M78 family)/transcriptional regulator with XRE-family HTH domain
MPEDIQLDLFSGSDVAKSFEASRLRQARVLMAWTKAHLAKEIGVSAAIIGQYEARVTKPSPDVLERLAGKLDVPVDFFAAGRPLAELDAGNAHFRSLRSTRAIDRSRAAAYVEQVWELSHALEKRVRFPELDLPDVPEGVGAVAAAKLLRQHWGIAPGPVRHLAATMENRGIIVTILSMARQEVATVDAFSTGWLGERPIVVVTPERSSTIYRYRFTCAHELGHLLLHRDFAPGDVRHEREADQFAAEFLTPAEQIAPHLPRSMDLAALDRLGRTWGVSSQSLVRRMGELRTVSESSVQRAYQRLRVLQSFEAAEPVASYPGEMPMLRQEAQRVAENSGFSIAALARELRWKPAYVREMLGMTDTRPSLSLVRDAESSR